MTALLSTMGVQLSSPSGRVLVCDLTMGLGREKVAVVGRNGVGKSSLLAVLAEQMPPDRGRVLCTGSVLLVPQDLPGNGASPGQARRQALEKAFRLRPDLLCLDEPTRDLDEDNRRWLFHQLDAFSGALVVVTHHRELLERFVDFFVMAETGCRHVSGSVSDLAAALQAADAEANRSYLKRLNSLVQAEEKHRRFQQRRGRKRAVGRLHELDRNQSKSRLNQRKSSAQVAHGRLVGVAQDRIAAARGWALAARRGLTVKMPLSVVVPKPAVVNRPQVQLSGVGVFRERWLFRGLDLCVRSERVALVGPNGSGKSSLLQLVAGERQPDEGQVLVAPGVGWVSQGATEFAGERSLRQRLAGSDEQVVSVLAAHGFPLALADRPMAGLSPGERMRAGLLLLFQRPGLTTIVLDEPGLSLDPGALDGLTKALAAWTGGLLIASHDARLLADIGVQRCVRLGG